MKATPADFDHGAELLAENTRLRARVTELESGEVLRRTRAELEAIRDHFESELVRGVAQATKEKDAEIARLTKLLYGDRKSVV